MSESLLSLTFIFAELGGVLLLVMIALVVRYVLGSRKDIMQTRRLIQKIKSVIPGHKEQLSKYFEGKLEQNKTDFNIETLIKDERKIYERLVNVSITKDMSLLKLTTEDINSLINNYVRLLTLKSEKETVVDEAKESRDLKLKKESEALRLENESLKSRINISEETIENMMTEFSSMYEGGKKEGEKRLKNEMYQLKQSINEEEAKVKAGLAELEKEDVDEDKSSDTG